MKQQLKNLQQLRPSRRAVATVIAFCIPVGGGWYVGCNMLERGGFQAAFLLLSCAAGLLGWYCPLWAKEQRNG